MHIGVLPRYRKCLHKKRTHLPKDRNFIVWNTNMATVTSCENLLYCFFVFLTITITLSNFSFKLIIPRWTITSCYLLTAGKYSAHGMQIKYSVHADQIFCASSHFVHFHHFRNYFQALHFRNYFQSLHFRNYFQSLHFRNPSPTHALHRKRLCLHSLRYLLVHKQSNVIIYLPKTDTDRFSVRLFPFIITRTRKHY